MTSAASTILTPSCEQTSPEPEDTSQSWRMVGRSYLPIDRRHHILGGGAGLGVLLTAPFSLR